MRSSPSMFSLPRRPSLGSPSAAAAPTMTATSPSSGSSTASASPASGEDTPTTRRKSNNDKLMRKDLGLPPPANQRRLLTRSPTADSAQRLGHQTRDFSLTVGSPSSPLPHENCSSLRDQFLKIKERFSSADHPSSPRSLPNSIRIPSPVTSPKSASSPPAALSERTDSSPSSPITVSVPTERLFKELNERTLRAYPHELLWPDHAHVERWYVEDNHFKGSMTCWTMERGAEVIARIARVISSQPASAPPPSSSPSSSSSSSVNRLNPDVSLQWIGRQLWAVTVSLPLTRNGELTSYHASIAQAIDEAIAEEVKKAPQECGPRATVAAATAAGGILPDTAPSVGSYRLNPLLDGGEEALEEEEEEMHRSQDESSSSPPSSPPPPDAQAEELAADKRVVPSDSSVSTVLAEGDGHEMAEDEAEDARVSSSKGSSAHNEEGDTVSALPLSLSMLSFTSLQSASGSGAEPGDPPALLHLHNGLEDDPSHRIPPDKTGWLKKKNGLNTWQPRYFELKGNRLFYFASETDGLPRGAIVLDHAHVLRGRGDQSMTFTICASPSLSVIKFSARMTSQLHPRKACVLRVTNDSEETLNEWITALNRASFTCHLSANSSASGSASSAAPHSSSSSTTPAAIPTQSAPPSSSTASTATPLSPTKKKRLPFYRLRTASSSSSASSADDNSSCTGTATSSCSSSASACLPHTSHTIDSAAYHHYGSVKYLQDTDPLLWEIHPHAQQKIRKRALLARTRADYLAILSKHSATVKQIFLPRPRPITIEQTLRDILPELFLINNVLYGGGDGSSNGLENIFEVLDTCIKKFASAQAERVRCVSALLQACARTISGGDSYFVVHALLGNPFMIIRPAEARGHPIEVEVSTTTPSHFRITVFSAFSFHHVEDVENCGDSSGGAAGSGGGAAMPEPLLRVQTYHVQEFDFAHGKSTRWLRIRTDGMKEDADSGRSSGAGGWMSKRTPSETGFGALLDALS